MVRCRLQFWKTSLRKADENNVTTQSTRPIIFEPYNQVNAIMCYQVTLCMQIENVLNKYEKEEQNKDVFFFFYSEDLFNLYIRTSPKQQGELSGFIINGHNCNGMEYADGTMWISDIQ